MQEGSRHSELLSHGSCDACGSSDANALYDDLHSWCFSCGAYSPPPRDGDTPSAPHERKRSLSSSDLIAAGDVHAILARKLTEETCSKWGYTVSEYRGQMVQVANYRHPIGGHTVFQKVRFANKDMLSFGDVKEAGLYGQHLWRDGGKMIVITEGEIDALSVSQIQGNRWPVVSIPNGVKGARKAIERQLQWLLQFDQIVLWFDDDEPGREAAQECALLFPPGRCKIARLEGYKDANDALKAGKAKEMMDAIFGARSFRPDGVVTISDVKDAALVPPVLGLPWFGDKVSSTLYGRRLGEIVMVGAGTGVGKTEFLAEQIYFDLVHLSEPVAVFLLEQSPVETVQRLAGKQAGKQFHIPDDTWTTEELRDAIGAIEDRRLYLYDNFGATDWDVIKSTIRFLAHSEGVRLFYLDHLTALAAAEDDERTGLERIMAEMGALVKELNVTIHAVSHLSTPEGKPHEEGGRVMIRHFKGSRAIGFWAHTMVGLERSQQDEDPLVRATTTFRILKHRAVGRAVGETIFFRYDGEIGRLIELDHDPSEDISDGRNNHHNSTHDFTGSADPLPF